jgi:hypothetical protein
MKRLLLVIAGLATVSACSNTRDRDIALSDKAAEQADLTLPDTSRADSSPMVVSRKDQPVSPVEQQVTRPEEPTAQPRPAKPRQPRRISPTVSARDTASAPDTSIRAYAPNGVSDSVVTSASDIADTTAAARPDIAAAAAPDTASTPPADTMVANTDTADVPPPYSEARASAAARTLPIGTEIHAALEDSITSRRDTVGHIVSAHVMQNVTGPDGKTLIAAGTPVRMTITRLRAAHSKSSQGRLALGAPTISINGQLQPVQAQVRPVPRELRGRGVTAGDAAKVGGGAVGGAVLGRVIGGNTRGAVIGGVAGAAAGAVVATQTATRDVVVKAKTPVVFVLSQPLVIP